MCNHHDRATIETILLFIGVNACHLFFPFFVSTLPPLFLAPVACPLACLPAWRQRRQWRRLWRALSIALLTGHEYDDQISHKEDEQENSCRTKEAGPANEHERKRYKE